MRTMRRFMLCSMLAASPAFGENVLTNGDFESGKARPWLKFSEMGALTIGAPAAGGARDSEFAARLDPGETFYAQLVPAKPGEKFRLSAYLLSETALDPDADASSFRSVKISFFDKGLNELEPAAVSIGRAGPDPRYPGIEALPLLDSTRGESTWHLTQASGEAPEGTVQVAVFLFNISGQPLWFDDVMLERLSSP